MSQTNYLSQTQVLDIHQKTVLISGGGALGVLSLGKLQGVLAHIQNDDYYPNFADKLTHLFFCTCKFHSFEDGNKRLAIVLSTQMLLLNGYLACAETFIREMENISYHVAAGRIDRTLLAEIMRAVLDRSAYTESLKLKILDAISL